jgi:hypothetical protein
LTRQEAADLDEEYDLGYAAERYTHVRLRRRADYYPDEEDYNNEDDDGYDGGGYFSSGSICDDPTYHPSRGVAEPTTPARRA